MYSAGKEFLHNFRLILGIDIQDFIVRKFD